MPVGNPPYIPNDEDRTAVQALLVRGRMTLAETANRLGISHDTIKRYYGDIVKAANLKGGPRPYEPTQEQRDFVIKASASGASHEDIATIMGFSSRILRDHFKRELKLGKAKANVNVAGKLYSMAMGDPKDKSTIIAAIYWTKTQMGWRETDRVEHTGPGGGPIQHQNQVVIMLPDNGRGDSKLPPERQIEGAEYTEIDDADDAEQAPLMSIEDDSTADEDE